VTFSEDIQNQCKGFTPLETSRMRESMLATGLRILGAKHGLLFREPLQIDSNGEFSLVAAGADDGPYPSWGSQPCGTYGASFVALLNKHNPRTGMLPTKYMDPSNGWCRINHFDVERMLNEGLA
jgi:hypothetical protein